MASYFYEKISRKHGSQTRWVALKAVSGPDAGILKSLEDGIHDTGMNGFFGTF
jgi:hypothetical protein